MHDAVLAERERVIVALRAQIHSLEMRLDKPIAVNVSLPKDFAVLQPAVVSKPRKRKQQDPDIPAAPFDLSVVDESDDRTIAGLVLAKYGRRASNSYELRQWVNGIKTEIRAAKAQKIRNRLTEPVEEVVAQLELDDVDTANVPPHILEKIAEAERVN